MTAAAEGIGAQRRARAREVVAAFGASVVLGLVLLLFFEVDVQQADPAELVARRTDARAFFAGDYLFIVLYALVSPIAIRRFGATFEGGPPVWLTLAVLLLPLAGIVDATENALLLSSTGSPSPDAVDFAHALAIPKIVLFVGGAGCAIAVVIRAIRVLR